jgi:hypothetical protein
MLSFHGDPSSGRNNLITEGQEKASNTSDKLSSDKHNAVKLSFITASLWHLYSLLICDTQPLNALVAWGVDCPRWPGTARG